MSEGLTNQPAVPKQEKRFNTTKADTAFSFMRTKGAFSPQTAVTPQDVATKLFDQRGLEKRRVTQRDITGILKKLAKRFKERNLEYEVRTTGIWEGKGSNEKRFVVGFYLAKPDDPWPEEPR